MEVVVVGLVDGVGEVLRGLDDGEVSSIETVVVFLLVRFDTAEALHEQGISTEW